jgi:hypothetical protein
MAGFDEPMCDRWDRFNNSRHPPRGSTAPHLAIDTDPLIYPVKFES